MGISLPGGGGRGRGKNLNAELNLVPFIDLLSVNITFLLLTAVWAQLSSLNVEQSIQDPNAEPPPPEEEPVPPLSVHIRSDGIWAGRTLETGQEFATVADSYDWEGLSEMLTTDRDTYPAEESVVIVTDDGVDYKFMIRALDLTRELGYPKTLLGGGPPSVLTATPTTGQG